jgi:DNA-binding response OmpR family regulator
MKLLLIEDNPQLAHWLEQILKEHKFKVDIAADGEIADQVLRDENYDVVLLDLMLPKMHGKNVLRRLRERHNGVPVMILTASGSIDEKVECLGAGADDYLVKPFEIRELVARIKVLVRRQTPTRPPKSTAATWSTTATRASSQWPAPPWRCRRASMTCWKC